MHRGLVVSSIAAAVVMATGAGLWARGGLRGRAPVRPAAHEGEGLVFRLSEGAEERSTTPAPTPAPAEVISAVETQRVLERLPAMTPAPDEARDFALRDESLPPPRTGKTLSEPFPPASSPGVPPVQAPARLEVLRRSPEGDVPLAPQLSITFSQPMVAVTSQEEAAQSVPVHLTPTPAGKWRWVGTKTLLFEAQRRFPMATEYEAEIPAGTKSAVGGALGQPVKWRFATPPPTIVAKYPEGAPARPDQVAFVAFDQQIDPAAVLSSISVTAVGAPAKLRLATAAEIEADVPVRDLAARTEKGRWLAFRPDAPLPSDANVTVKVGPQTPSLEGPRKTAAAQEWSYRTYGPLRIARHGCGWDNECRPSTPWFIELSNPIDARVFRKGMLRVAPAVPDMQVYAYGNTVQVYGRTRARTTYQVTLAAELPDAFGQTLGQDGAVTFTVGEALPHLAIGGNGIIVLDPATRPSVSVYSMRQPALNVKVHSVTAEDWPAFVNYVQYRQGVLPPGRLVFERKLVPEGDPDERIETLIDLQPALKDGLGQLVLSVDGTARARGAARPDGVRVWVQATRMGLDAFADATDLLGWATRLADGRPLDGVTLALWPGGAKAATANGGQATLSLPKDAQKLLIARQGADVAILPAQGWRWSNGWSRRERVPDAIWHIFDDRGLYRPGEEARIKGWLREAGYGKGGDVAAWPSTQRLLSYTFADSRGNEVAKGQTPLNAFGGFDLTLPLPKTMNLGRAVLSLNPGTSPGYSEGGVHAIRVEEFRRPEFEVKARASEGPFFLGGRALVTASASYYAGGALTNADTAWSVTATPGSFTPPNREDYSFGRWRPWWESSSALETDDAPQTLTGRTDAAGRHVLRVDFDSSPTARPFRVRAEASVQDVNRQAWTAAATLLVHPASLYVGLKSERLFVQQGQPLAVSAIVTDLDGRAVAGRPVTLRAERMVWEQEGEALEEKGLDAQEREITSTSEAQRVELKTTEGGAYRITAQVRDDQGRLNETQIRLWVAGGQQQPARSVEAQKVTLIPSKKEYRAGEMAEILVLAPFADAEGLLTLRRSGVLHSEHFRISGTSHTLRVKVEEKWTPNVFVQVDLVGAARRVDANGRTDENLAPRPAFASGALDLAVPPYERTLALSVAPRDKAVEPAGRTEVVVDVRDAAGKALANAEVTLVVADEAVLALSGYELADPLKSIYPHREAGGMDAHQRADVVLTQPESLAQHDIPVGGRSVSSLVRLTPGAAAPPPMPRKAMRASEEKLAALGYADGAAPEFQRGRLQVVTKSGISEEEPAAPIALRADFNPLALFVASAVTDGEGRARASVKLPDSVTRYRVMAVATDGAKCFGKGESTITARLPLMVRPSAPRFLNFGDRFELPIVLQNQTDSAMKVDLAARASNAGFVPSSGRSEGEEKTAATAGRRVTVPANDRVEVRLPATAVRAGTARFQVAAVSGRFTDAADVSLPVWTPATTEAFATYGQIDDEKAVAQPVQAPSGVVREYGGLEITTSSTALQALTDAVMYLAQYPYGCAEQISSRVLAVAALKDVLTAFEAEGLPKREEMVAAVGRDLERLKSLQNEDGGFAFWERGQESWPYVSIHVANALVRAQAKGFSVDAGTLSRSKGYLREIEGHIPKWYGADARRTLIAYALRVRQQMGDRDAVRARKLVAEAGVEKLSFEALGWLLGVMSGDPASQAEATAIRRHLANRATETASTAHYAVDYGDGAYVLLYSDRRADAVVLEALIGDQPENDLIPKLVEGLLGHRKAGRWLNTQENVFILLALDRYFNTYEKVTPDFVARAWLGERYAGEHAFRGRTTERSHIAIPMSALAPKPEDLILAKQGKGRLYYRIGMQYAPASLTLEPADYGFTVERRYEGLDKSEDVRRDASGVWHVKAGSRVRVTLTMVAPSRRYHVALVDPLPAGLEPLNPELATTGTIPRGQGEDVTLVGAPGMGGPSRPGWWWWQRGTWYEHQNMRDERVEAFTSLLFEGVYKYSYAATATTPGVFVVPPPKAEEMYHRETFGRGASDHVIVE